MSFAPSENKGSRRLSLQNPGNEVPTHADMTGSTVQTYIRWNLHTTVTLEREDTRELPRQLPICSSSPCSRSRIQRPVQPPVTDISPSGKTQAVLCVERLITRNVAVLCDCRNPDTVMRWVGKFFRSDYVSSLHLTRETQIYNQCSDLQGMEIPIFYGEWKIRGTPTAACSALLLEYISPGTTVRAICDAFVSLQSDWDQQARYRLAELHSSGTRAVDKLGRCGASHRNLSGENMILSATEIKWDETLVIVDFEIGAVFDVTRETEYEDWRLFHRSFML